MLCIYVCHSPTPLVHVVKKSHVVKIKHHWHYVAGWGLTLRPPTGYDCVLSWSKTNSTHASPSRITFILQVGLQILYTKCGWTDIPTQNVSPPCVISWTSVTNACKQLQRNLFEKLNGAVYPENRTLDESKSHARWRSVADSKKYWVNTKVWIARRQWLSYV